MKKTTITILLIIWFGVLLIGCAAPIIISVLTGEWLALLIYLAYPFIGSFLLIGWMFVFALLVEIGGLGK